MDGPRVGKDGKAVIATPGGGKLKIKPGEPVPPPPAK